MDQDELRPGDTRTNWMPITEETLPTKEDADHNGAVMVWHVYSGMRFSDWRAVRSSRYNTHWARLPARPEGAETEAEALRKDMLQYGRDQYGKLL